MKLLPARVRPGSLDNLSNGQIEKLSELLTGAEFLYRSAGQDNEEWLCHCMAQDAARLLKKRTKEN